MGIRKGQKHYSEEFKQKVLMYIKSEEVGSRIASKNFGVSRYAIRSWIKQAENSSIKKVKRKELTELEAIKQENEQLKMENTLLKAFQEAITREEQKRNFRL